MTEGKKPSPLRLAPAATVYASARGISTHRIK